MNFKQDLITQDLLIYRRILNRELIKASLAWWYRRYSDDQSLGDLERVARKILIIERLNPILPWEFRRKLNMKETKI